VTSSPPSVVAVIPARGGSKGVPGKNLRPVGGYPLIAFSVAAARLCSGIDRTIVSTDSPEIAEVARSYGAEVPFLRPAELAQDRSPDIDFVLHLVRWLEGKEGRAPTTLVNLRPTTPLRDPALVDAAIRALGSAPEASSLRSVHPLAEPPQKMMGMENGYVDLYRPLLVKETGFLHGPRVLGFVTPVTAEVDTPEDIVYLEFLLARSGHPLLRYLEERFDPLPSGEGKRGARKR
jgi:CMP-N,N'-diacetyllegionaminic acid synthase